MIVVTDNEASRNNGNFTRVELQARKLMANDGVKISPQLKDADELAAALLSFHLAINSPVLFTSRLKSALVVYVGSRSVNMEGAALYDTM